MSTRVPDEIVEPVGESAEFRLPDALPVLALRETVVFPLAVVPLSVGQERSLRAPDR